MEIRVTQSMIDKSPQAQALEAKKDEEDENLLWIPVRASFRYVTSAPWNRIPVVTKTLVLNKILCCLSGGRNKLVASKAYELLNSELQGSGLAIRTPETITDVNLAEVPLYVESWNWHAVIKNPYSNAGQGVYTITSKEELEKFMEIEHSYDQFIVQALVGNSKWSSAGKEGTFYHVGTIPNTKNHTYVADCRMMIQGTKQGYRPLACYARRARFPLTDTLDDVRDSWGMLGTNLSLKESDGTWGSDTARLMLMDRKDFNKLGISIDDLIDGFVQTTLAAIAIDQMCNRLLDQVTGSFNLQLFASLDRDKKLVEEIKSASKLVGNDEEGAQE